MKDSNKLKCTDCGSSNFELSVVFDGCGTNGVKNEGSKFDYAISLDCDCGCAYPIGRLSIEF